MVNKNLIITIVFGISFFIPWFSYAQLQSSEENILVPYKYQVSGSILLHTSGYGVGFSYDRYDDYLNLTTFNTELVFVKHEKERKRYNDYYDYNKNAKGFVYGKLNSFFMLRPSYGKTKIFTNKLREKGVQLSHTWELGPAIGFLKPIYLEIDPEGVSFNSINIVTERYDPEEHPLVVIYGRASNFRGLNEVKIRPGLHLKYGINLEYSDYREGMKGIEVGVSLDAFLEEIEIMAEDVYGIGGAENKQFFAEMYIKFFVGRKSSL